jgi:hypothetical protein
MDAVIDVKVGGQLFHVEYVVLQTRAPKAYDYGYVLRLDESEGNAPRSAVRTVAVPKRYAPEQIARYASGLFYAAPVDELLDDATVLDAITSKLFRYTRP